MRKTLLHILVFGGIAGGSASIGCSEPIVALVGVVQPSLDASLSHPMRDAAVHRDAGVIHPQDSGPPPAQRDAAPMLEDCVDLVEQATRLQLDAGVDPDAQVLGFTLQQLSCQAVDMEPLTSSVFERRDQAPMIEAGHMYSFRWDATVLFTQLRLFGGPDKCSREPCFLVPPTASIPPVLAGACRDFSSPFDIRFLRLIAGDYVSIAYPVVQPVRFQLCRGPCP